MSRIEGCLVFTPRIHSWKDKKLLPQGSADRHELEISLRGSLSLSTEIKGSVTTRDPE